MAFKVPKFQKFMAFQRKVMGMTIDQAAAKLDRCPNRLSRVERGVDPMPMHLMQRWTAILGVPKHIAVQRIVAELEEIITVQVYGDELGIKPDPKWVGDYKIGSTVKEVKRRKS